MFIPMSRQACPRERRPRPSRSRSSAAHARRLKLFDPVMVRMATWQSFVMLNPRNMMRNPVMFLVEVGTVLTAIVTVQSILAARRHGPDRLPGVR